MNKQVSPHSIGGDLAAVINTNPGKGEDRALDRAGFYAHITQATPKHFQRLPIQDSVLIIVRSGRKEATSGTTHVRGGVGEIVGIAGGEALDLINYGPDAGGPYEADAFGFDDSLVSHVGAHLPDSCRRAGLFMVKPGSEFETSFASAREALDPARNVPPEIIRHRMSELLVWLVREGVYFATRREANTAIRVRQLVTSDAAHNWGAAEIASRLGMSEATLRRRLREHGQSIGSAVSDARMSMALGMLHASKMPIDRVALEVGYSSASKFALRFRARFGLAPSEIRVRRT